jgi:hypothetical protein
MKKIKTLTLILATSFGAYSQDYCNDVLVAAYNTLSINSSQSSVSAAKSWFCSDNFFSDIRDHAAGGKITIPIYGVPVEFGGTYNSQSSLQKREQFCSSSSSYFSNDQALVIFKQVVEKRTIEAWERCMIEKFKAIGNSSIYLEEDISGNEIFVKAKFRITDESSRDIRPLVMTCIYTNAIMLKGDWREGNEVPLSGIIQHFRRIDENEPVTIVLTATRAVSQTLFIRAKEYPFEVGEITATWEEPYQGESEPQEIWVEKVTGDHHCSSNCKGEPTRTNYTMKLETRDNSGRLLSSEDGYLKEPKLNCVDGPCGGWHEIKELRLISQTVAYGSWDVWTRPTKWRLSAKWVYYTTKYKKGSSSKTLLRRGDQFIIKIPDNARNVRVYGKTLDGSFDFTLGTITSSKWLKYLGTINSDGYYNVSFIVRKRPQ